MAMQAVDVMTLDLSKDPYGRKYYAHMNRIEFNKWKKTKEGKSWYNIQLRAQKNKCAWCLKKLQDEIHIDHVQPLYYDGKNEIDNLVISCARCNVKKWVNDRYVYPQWIKDSKAKHRVKILRSKQRKLYKELVEQDYQEQLAQDLGWIQ